MTYIRDEIPSGDVDGENTVFTADYSVYSIDAVYLDGEYYQSGVVVSGDSSTTITLTDPPKSSIYIKYFTTTVV